jgi:hypothetical protein
MPGRGPLPHVSLQVNVWLRSAAALRLARIFLVGGARLARPPRRPLGPDDPCRTCLARPTDRAAALVDRMVKRAPAAATASPGDILGAGHGLHLYIPNQQTTAGLYQSEAIVNLMCRR